MAAETFLHLQLTWAHTWARLPPIWILWTNRGSDIFLYFPLLDDKAPVTDTNIPSHLEQMLDILTQEEGERESGETGPCMEYLLHHKILETLYTLGKADVRQS